MRISRRDARSVARQVEIHQLQHAGVGTTCPIDCVSDVIEVCVNQILEEKE